MAEENKSTTEGNIVETKQHVDVLDASGNSLSGSSALASLFDKIEAGKGEGKTADQVISEGKKAPSEPPAKKPDAEQKPADDKKDKEASPPKEEKTGLDAALSKKEEGNKAAKPEGEGDKKADKGDDAKDGKDKDEHVPDDELQVLNTDKPRTAKRIQALLKKIDAVQGQEAETKKQLEERDAKLKELQDQLGKVKTLDPETEKEIEKTKTELQMFRRRYALENDPEVKTRFEGRITSAEKSIVDVLSKNGAGEPILNMIKEAGGWQKFADSGRVYNLRSPVTIGGREVESLTGAEFAEFIVSQLPITSRRAIDAAMVEQVQTERDRQRFFEEEQSKATEHFKKLDEEGKKAQEARDKQIREAAETIEKWHKGVVEKNDWLKEKSVPANATPEQKAAIEEDNKFTKQLSGLITKALSVNKVEDSLEIIFDSVRYHQERREKGKLASEVEKLKKEVEQKQAELDKFRRASASAKGGSLTAGSKSSSDAEAKKPMSIEDAFDEIANRKASGGE